MRDLKRIRIPFENKQQNRRKVAQILCNPFASLTRLRGASRDELGGLEILRNIDKSCLVELDFSFIFERSPMEHNTFKCDVEISGLLSQIQRV